MAQDDQRPKTAGVVAPPPLIVLAALLTGLAIDYLLGLGGGAPAWLRVIAALMGLAALGLGGVAAWTMHRAHTAVEPWKPSTHLVSRGIFAHTRNPIYVGLLLLLAGFALWFASPGIALLLPVCALVLHHGVVLREERYLSTVFGAEYRDYMARVRRWL